MRISDFQPLILRNLRSSFILCGVLVYGSLFAGARLLLGLPNGHRLGVELVLPYLFALGVAFLAPLPWLWTGDCRPRASGPRGLLQAVPWNTGWLLSLGSLALLFSLLTSHPAPRLPLGAQAFNFGAIWGFFVFNFPLTLVLGWFLAERECIRAAERELRALADSARAQALQSQLTPHALFNILSGITELVHEDPDATEAALVELVELYRELTRHGAALQAPLRREREILERYLDLEAIRLEDRLEVVWDWPPWADALELPPLLLQPLVENSIKHGISPSPEGGRLRVQILRSPESLVLQVANTGCPLAERPSEGTGLANLRARLALMPVYRPRLTLAQEGGEVVARLVLDWKWDG